MVGKKRHERIAYRIRQLLSCRYRTYYIIILNLLGYNIDWFTLKEGLYIISNNTY